MDEQAELLALIKSAGLNPDDFKEPEKIPIVYYQRFCIVRIWDKMRRSNPMYGFTFLAERHQERVVARFDEEREARAHLSRLTHRYKTHGFRHLLMENGQLASEG